jgi:coenzyme A diphosphatase NUDT7
MDEKTIFNKVKRHHPSILGSKDFSKYAVFLPLVQKDGEVNILFEIRSNKLNRQPGEICFPGGKIDTQDKTEEDAAIRETMEELGVERETISCVSPLDYLITPFGMIVYPYVGRIHYPERIQANPTEVEEIFMVPLSFFLKTKPQIFHVNFEVEPEENFPFDLIVGGRDYNWRTGKKEEYFYYYEDKVIWGLTAKILAHFVEVIR